jgi:Kef-type K+ transport system membrane component KefB
VSSFDLSVLFFLQIAVILLACRLVGWLGRLLRQPQVVSEMIAGVLLGPSLFGALLPGPQAWLFPKASMPILFAVSQVGLSLYMFTIGLEFDVGLIRKRMKSALSISAAGIVVPFLLGCVLALFLYGGSLFYGERSSRTEAMLFTGAAMGITAFPMLARIIYERGIAGTSLGTLALAAGSSDDAAAWCVLAVVLASFSGEPKYAVYAIGGGVGYAVLTLTLGRRALAGLGRLVEREGKMTPPVLGGTLALVMLGAWFTDYIHIYAVFGAFIMGAAMPRGLFQKEIERLVGPFVTTFLLPMFFVYSGLNTRIGLVNTAALWGVTALACLAATLGKGGACWAAARLNGETPREAVAIGALMNARGLMELIILNIGLERGIVQPTLFTIMVLMAILTTLAASPVFEWVYPPARVRELRGPVPEGLL